MQNCLYSPSNGDCNYITGGMLSMVGNYVFPDGLRLRVYEEPMFRMKEVTPMVLYAKVYFGDNKTKLYDYLTFITGLEQNDVIIVQASDGIAYAKFYGYSSTRGLGTKYIVAKVDECYLDNKINRTSITIMPKCYGNYSFKAHECATCKIRTICEREV